jgi:hypothetical protein
MLSQNVSCKGKKPRIISPLIKTSKMKKILKQKPIHLHNESTPKTTTPRNQGFKNKSHILKLMILLFSTCEGKRRILAS